MTAPPTELEVLRARLRAFAEHDAAGESPLYEHLALAIANDDEVTGLLAAAGPDRAEAALLLAAAHRLVLAEPASELAHYYRSVGGHYGVDDATWPLFREFVLDRADRMRELIATRTIRTDEVRHAAALYPAVARVARVAGGPVGLLQLGAGAGLLLGLDRYGYRYQLAAGEQVAAGPARAPLVLSATLEIAAGARRPTLPRRLAVQAGVGLDGAPVDLADEDEFAWLEACVWADQPERLRLLNAAAASQAGRRPELVTGDPVDDLAEAAGRVPAELPLVVLTNHALRALPADRRAALADALAALAAHRPLWWVSQEAYEVGLAPLLPDRLDLHGGARAALATVGVVHWPHGRPVAAALGQASAHGQRLRWLAR